MDEFGRKYNFVFVLNNYTDDEVEHLREFSHQCRYIIWGYETAPTTGTPHLQGYIELDTAKTESALKKCLGNRFYVAVANGNGKQNFIYSTKETKYEEYGVIKRQGKRTDIVRIREGLRNGDRFSEILSTVTSFQGIRILEKLSTYQPTSRKFIPKRVEWFYGPSGVGKTRRAYEEVGDNDFWVSSDKLEWFDGYAGQEYVIFDDFRGSSCVFSMLLRLLDGYEFRVPIKGGFVTWRPLCIFITSCQSPHEAYALEQNRIDQLLRRITLVDYMHF